MMVFSSTPLFSNPGRKRVIAAKGAMVCILRVGGRDRARFIIPPSLFAAFESAIGVCRACGEYRVVNGWETFNGVRVLLVACGARAGVDAYLQIVMTRPNGDQGRIRLRGQELEALEQAIRYAIDQQSTPQCAA